MSKKLAQVIALVLLGVLLATLSGLAGCAKEEGAKKEIVFGFLWDVTGRAAFATTKFHTSLKEYLRFTQEEDPIPGVEIKVVTYDTKSEPARVAPGYLWLQGKGAQIVSAAAHDCEALLPRLEADEVPSIGLAALLSVIDNPWTFFIYPPPEADIEVLMQWIMDSWDYEKEGRRPKVGFVGYGGYSFYEFPRARAEEVAEANQDKIEWLGAEMPPVGAMTFAAEIAHLIDSDILICVLTGPPLASFAGEARERGFEGQFAGNATSFYSFWDVVTDVVPLEDLDGTVTTSWGPLRSEDVAGNRAIIEHVFGEIEPTRDERDDALRDWANGWHMGPIIMDSVRRAVAEVGAENIDGRVLRDMLAEFDMEMDGYGNRWYFLEDCKSLTRTIKMAQYRSAEDDWVSIGDYYQPPCLAD